MSLCTRFRIFRGVFQRTSLRAQATVEAAYAIPILMMVLLMCLQPAIVTIDLIIMRVTAHEGCRMLATASPSDASKVEALLKRRLHGIPPIDIFHIESPDCSWDITLSGDETSEKISVEISNTLRPLPLIGSLLLLLGSSSEGDTYTFSVREEMSTQPGWLGSAPYDPHSWVVSS